MKLYDVPNGTKIRVLGEVSIPPDAPEINKGDELFFYKIDGMYSHCVNSDGIRVYIAAWTEVEIIENVPPGGYGDGNEIHQL